MTEHTICENTEQVTIDVTQFIGENGKTIQYPFRTIIDVTSFITSLLNRYKSQNSLTWHYTNIQWNFSEA